MRRFNELPEEVVVRSLGHLDAQGLMAARLVCSAWRDASIAVLTWLSMCPEPWWGPPPQHSPDTLASRLRVLLCVRELALGIHRREDLGLLQVAACLTLLKSLDLTWAGHSAADFSGTTALTRLRLGVPPERGLLSQWGRLRVLDSRNLSVQGWLRLLPLLAGLPHLRDVGKAPLADQRIMEGLVALTQLTAIRADTGSTFISCRHLEMLTALEGLRALSLEGLRALSLGCCRSDGGALERFIQSAPPLEELFLCGPSERAAAGELGCLTRLIKLRVNGAD